MYNVGSPIKIYIIKYVKLFNIFIGNKNKWNITWDIGTSVLPFSEYEWNRKLMYMYMCICFKWSPFLMILIHVYMIKKWYVCFWPCSCLTHKKNTGSRIYLHIYSYKADIGILLKYRGAFEVRRRIW